MMSKTRKKRNLLWRVFPILLVLILAFLAVSIVRAQATNTALEQEIERMRAQCAEQMLINESLAEKVDDPGLYLKEQAREKGFVFPGEEVFQEVPGN